MIYCSNVVALTTLVPMAKIAAMSDWRDGSYVIGDFDWEFGNGLRFKMVARNMYGSLLREVNQATESPHRAARWQSRQAARQRLRALQATNKFGQGWEVVNLKKLGTH